MKVATHSKAPAARAVKQEAKRAPTDKSKSSIIHAKEPMSRDTPKHGG